jgi:hypothetical protein
MLCRWAVKVDMSTCRRRWEVEGVGLMLCSTGGGKVSVRWDDLYSGASHPIASHRGVVGGVECLPSYWVAMMGGWC